jgi:hypothetical protein
MVVSAPFSHWGEADGGQIQTPFYEPRAPQKPQQQPDRQQQPQQQISQCMHQTNLADVVRCVLEHERLRTVQPVQFAAAGPEENEIPEMVARLLTELQAQTKRSNTALLALALVIGILIGAILVLAAQVLNSAGSGRDYPSSYYYRPSRYYNY